MKSTQKAKKWFFSIISSVLVSVVFVVNNQNRHWQIVLDPCST